VYVWNSFFTIPIIILFPFGREGIFYHRNLQLPWAD
jgi:hypothetical protein